MKKSASWERLMETLREFDREYEQEIKEREIRHRKMMLRELALVTYELFTQRMVAV